MTGGSGGSVTVPESDAAVPSGNPSIPVVTTLPKVSGPCAKLKFAANSPITSTIGVPIATDAFTWQDASCLPRTAAMARLANGYLRQITYQYDGKTRTVSGTNASNRWNGFGFTVNHGMKGGAGAPGGQFQPVFVGDHHAIYQYTFEVSAGLPVTLSWLFATGRDHPLLAITYDMSKRTAGIEADTRTPYGDMAFDGDESAATTQISGVAWGDRYQFVTTAAPLTLNSTWDYTQKNQVPYAMEWVDKSDAEMGIVQTQTYLQKDAGGYWLYKNWGKTSANQIRDTDQLGQMPISWNWTYQLDQYELCYQMGDGCVGTPTASHRISWGTNYGAIGGDSKGTAGTYASYGDDKRLVGFPYNSYSVFVALGKHSTKTVLTQAHEVELAQKTTITATVGTVLTDGPAGVGRTDTAKLAPVGYDQRFSTWNIQAEGNKAEFTAAVAQEALVDPIVVVSNFTGTVVPAITVDGVAAVADTDFFASLDSTTQTLWITFRPGWTGTKKITIG
jgi:hypothetical protein